MKRKFSPLFYNWVTYFGVWLSFFVFLSECFLFVIDFFAHGHNLYLGLLTYLVLPPFLFIGLALIPLGALWKRHRVRKGLTELEPKPLVINPSIPTHRNAIFVFMTGTFIVVVMTFVGAYKAFHFTESVKFCGLLCHKVMRPEFTAYSNSPHGRVKCVECHIGAGADWYLRSKISGSRQVLKTLTNSYEKPIRTPVHDLRPAEETCKQCHWPGKYFSTLDLNRDYFLTEGENPRWHIRMLFKVGGGDHQARGVHAHMNLDRDVYYVADDEKRQKISWVRAVDKDGTETIFTAPGSKYEREAPPARLIRKMDCIDCHNRPTHQFRPPYQLVNEALQAGDIDANIPAMKAKAMEVLSKKYASQGEGVRTIRQTLTDYYSLKEPDYFREHGDKIEKAITVLTDAYSKNMFPEMGVRWDTHPDNIGHLISDGCFRCHDGEHQSAKGRIISKDCKACHTIIEQGPAGAIEKKLDGLDFKHPTDIEDQWKESSCTDCHNGGN